LLSGEWHTPYAQHLKDLDGLTRAHVSAGICGRVSYNRHDDLESIHDSVKRAEMFIANKHWSPLQHQGVVALSKQSGNFFGYTQFRKLFAGEGDALSTRDVWWKEHIK
jgi:hypothetical protein